MWFYANEGRRGKNALLPIGNQWTHHRCDPAKTFISAIYWNSDRCTTEGNLLLTDSIRKWHRRGPDWLMAQKESERESHVIRSIGSDEMHILSHKETKKSARDEREKKWKKICIWKRRKKQKQNSYATRRHGTPMSSYLNTLNANIKSLPGK